MFLFNAICEIQQIYKIFMSGLIVNKAYHMEKKTGVLCSKQSLIILYCTKNQEFNMLIFRVLKKSHT